MTQAILTNTYAIPIEEFLARSTEGRFEYINGEWVEKMGTILTNAYFIKLLMYTFIEIEKQGLGEFFIETTFILGEKPRWVKGSRNPDVMFYTHERVQELQLSPNWHKYPATVVPNIGVEVISPTDIEEDVIRKAHLYLEDGVELVWLILPDSKRIEVFTSGSKTPHILEGDDAVLTGVPILPEFNLPLNQLFAL